MILGIIIAVFVLGACSMYFTKRSKSVRFQKWNNRLHKGVGIFTLPLIVLHLLMIWPLRLQRPNEMYYIGYMMTLLIVFLILSYYNRAKLGQRWRLLHRIAAFLLLLCLITHVYLGVHSLQVYQKQVSSIEIEQIDLSSIPSGTYVGEENVGYIYCKVEVTVEDHKLMDVKIMEHRTERGRIAEAITRVMIEKQSNKVDAVSSATNSSKVIMKAVENALRN